MIARILPLLLVLCVTVLSVMAPAHAGAMVAGREPAMVHATAMVAQTPGTECCAGGAAMAGHDALCAFACTPVGLAQVAAPGSWRPLVRPADFPRLATVALPGQMPGQPERPPRTGLLPV